MFRFFKDSNNFQLAIAQMPSKSHTTMYFGYNDNLGNLGFQATIANLFIFLYKQRDNGPLMKIDWSQIFTIRLDVNDELIIQFIPGRLPSKIQETFIVDHRLRVRIHHASDFIREMFVLGYIYPVKGFIDVYYRPNEIRFFVKNKIWRMDAEANKYEVYEEDFLQEDAIVKQKKLCFVINQAKNTKTFLNTFREMIRYIQNWF